MNIDDIFDYKPEVIKEKYFNFFLFSLFYTKLKINKKIQKQFHIGIHKKLFIISWVDL